MPWNYLTVAGPSTTNEPGFVDGIGEEARFSGPCGTARHPTEPWKFYICDYHNNAIRQFDMITKEVTTVAEAPHPAFISVNSAGESIIACNPTPVTGSPGQYRSMEGTLLFDSQLSPRGCLAKSVDGFYYGSRNADSLFGASVYGRFMRMPDTWIFGSWGGAFNNDYWFFGCAEIYETNDPVRVMVCTADYFDEGGWIVWRDGSSYGQSPANPPRRIITGGVHSVSETPDKRLWIASGPYGDHQYIGRTTASWRNAAEGRSYANIGRENMVSVRPVSVQGHYLSNDICYFTDCSFEQLGSGGGSRTYVPGSHGYNRIGLVYHTDIGLFESGWTVKQLSIG